MGAYQIGPVRQDILAGVQGSNVDFLICSFAQRRSLPIFTTDADFRRFAKILPIALHAGS